MKRKSIITLALVASITSTAFADFNAPLPEFKTAKQLAEWRAEMAAKSDSKPTATPDTAFYTGKPYLASSGSYTFKYRSYNPELARWTSEDPSGFPDGANQSKYAPTPTTQFDSFGLFLSGTNYTWGVGGVFNQIDDMAAWTALETSGPTLVATIMKYADGTNSGDWTFNQNESNLVKTSSDYIFGYTPQVVAGVSPLAYGAASTPTVNYLFTKPSECYYAFGHARLATSGQKTSIFPRGAWGYDATVTFSEKYLFTGYATSPWYTPTALGYRLQAHGYVRDVNVSGSWNDTFFGAE